MLAFVAAFALFGGLAASWSNEEIDWSMLGSVAKQGRPVARERALVRGGRARPRPLRAHRAGDPDLARGRHRRGAYLGDRGDPTERRRATSGGRLRRGDDAHRRRADGHPLHVRPHPLHGRLQPVNRDALRRHRPHKLARHGADRPGPDLGAPRTGSSSRRRSPSGCAPAGSSSATWSPPPRGGDRLRDAPRSLDDHVRELHQLPRARGAGAGHELGRPHSTPARARCSTGPCGSSSFRSRSSW